MNRFITAVVALGMAFGVASTGIAAGDGGTYVRGSLGYGFNDANDALSDSDVVSGAVGYDFGFVRTEADVTWATSSGATGDVETFVVGGAVALEWDNDTMFTPFVSAGVGYAFVNEEDVFGFVNQDDSGFVYTLGAGTRVGLAGNLDLEVGYEYTTGDVDVVNTGLATADYETHEVTVGLVFDLN